MTCMYGENRERIFHASRYQKRGFTFGQDFAMARILPWPGLLLGKNYIFVKKLDIYT